MLTRRSFATVAALAVAACGPSIQFDRDDTVPIPVGATYAYPPEDHSEENPADPSQTNTIVQTRIQKAVDGELARKGYKRVYDVEQAEFVVRYFWNVAKSTQMVTTTTPVVDPYMGYGWGYGYGWGWGYTGYATTTMPVTVSEGTFVLDLVDKDTRKLAWRATWQGEPKGRAPTQEELNEGAANLMAKVPPVKAASGK
jgi:hypothetical protein